MGTQWGVKRVRKSSRNPVSWWALAACLLIAGFSWFLAVKLNFSLHEPAFAISVFFLGLSLGPCLTVYLLVPKTWKDRLRRLVLLSGGLSIISLSLLGRMNMELEGFFMLCMTATMGAAVGHTLVTVIIGPMLFGRFLCGWGCWRAMILELLPASKSPGRRQGIWSRLPLVGLSASMAGVAISYWGLGLAPGGTPEAMHGGSLMSLAIGIGIYYLASVGLALALRDPRAFCKYLCPSSVILRQSSRFSLLRLSARRESCNQCGACSRTCPMDIDVARLVQIGGRVASGECILCQRCAHACPQGALHLSFGWGVARGTPFIPSA